MSDFLTVKEAALQTGLSASSIRRIFHQITKDDHHPDRYHVRPSPDEVRELRLKGENFPWQVSRELLERELAKKQPPPSNASDTHVAETPLQELNVLLRDELGKAQAQLQVKDQQIASFMELTKDLHERLREGNVLLGTLQRQLALPESALKTKETVAPKQQAPAKTTPAKPVPAKKPVAKRGFWRRIFS